MITLNSNTTETDIWMDQFWEKSSKFSHDSILLSATLFKGKLYGKNKSAAGDFARP